MGVVVRLDDEGRILLPPEMRDALGLAPGDAVEVVAEGGREVLLRRPRLPLESLIGIVRYDGSPVSVAEMDEGIAEAISEDDAATRWQT